ncbi:sigma-54-dependent transcriptional regulator [Polyangium mundeleinium]|uniref:Sigma-54 dependent transcriptional regulator n=1 Tax=Polyangium mundeleinium TaxID=2995306 RepID=A0ABT5ES82_9BACT|nr:sigma-54 dependent transcriptional regulator [Polyangium mundeleinium]MDC0744675.1 sigma-54 dependent transcriptional regulator [Polyangium mundeleinium]
MEPAKRTPMNLLVVEDDAPLAELFVGIAEKRGLRASRAATIAEGRARIEAGDVEILLTDMRLPDGSGIDLIEWTRKADPRIVILAITAFGSIEIAVRAVRQGAYDFLTKPVEPAVLAVALDRAMEARRLRGEVEALRGALATESALRGIIGKSRALADITSVVRRVADAPATVLVTGPSGSGKELVARALHEASRRKEAPFIAVNAAAIPETLLESELFGYKKGAFTDARQDKKGIFVEADGGTLFLDEIGDLPLVLQAKILRVLEEREVRPLGATRSVPVDARVVAATNHDLRKAVKEGRFREDLFYRLAVIEIAIPPLRDRPEDILPLAEHFLGRAKARAGRSLQGFSGAAARVLMAYDWPGNVRELENAVERAVALAQDEWISPDDLPPTVQKPSTPDLFASAAERMMTLEEVDRAYVKHVLERFGGNKVRAAAALGINRRTIQRWLGEEE